MFGLIPLETLPGWPAAPDPTAIQALTVMLGVPAAIAGVILLLCMAPRRSRSTGDQGNR